MKTPETFVPLTAATAAPASREFRVAILNGHDHHSNGHSNGNGNSSNHGNDHANGSSPGNGKSNGVGGQNGPAFQSLPFPRPAALNGANNGEVKISEPRVTVQRDGDRVTHLRIQCTCGQIMDLACIYDNPAPKT